MCGISMTVIGIQRKSVKKYENQRYICTGMSDKLEACVQAYLMNQRYNNPLLYRGSLIAALLYHNFKKMYIILCRRVFAISWDFAVYKYLYNIFYFNHSSCSMLHW